MPVSYTHLDVYKRQPLAYYLNFISQAAGTVTVIAAGNETGYGHHYLGAIPETDRYEDVELRVAPGETGFTVELWARQPDLYTVGFISPTGEYADRIPYTSRQTSRIAFLLEMCIRDRTRTAEIPGASSLL